MTRPSQDLLENLRAAVGPKGVVDDESARQAHLTEWRDRFKGDTPLIVAPATTEEVARIVALCAEAGVAITPQGGNTGLVGGQIPYGDEILLSLRRLNRIRNVSPLDNTLTAEAGVTLAAVQDAAADVDRLFPLSLGAEGTCQIGGVISTNAGGVNVIRYGNTRDLVLGLEAVTPDGRIWNGLRRLRKDNTGYDLKHMFIGAEGTLGVITAAVLKLFPAHRETVVAFMGVPSPQAAVELLSHAQDAFAGRTTSFELIGRRAIEFVLKHIPDTRDPLADIHPWYVLFEAASGRDGGLRDTTEALLASEIEDGRVVDAVIAENMAQTEQFWRIRHSISEAQKPEGGEIKHDVSAPIASLPAFLEKADAAVERIAPGARPVSFGHVGDGNIHYDIAQPEGGDVQSFIARREEISRAVHDIVASFDGSISAEHGLGRLKAGEILRYKSETEIEMMRALKAALDPGGIMNPGKVLARKP